MVRKPKKCLEVRQAPRPVAPIEINEHRRPSRVERAHRGLACIRDRDAIDPGCERDSSVLGHRMKTATEPVVRTDQVADEIDIPVVAAHKRRMLVKDRDGVDLVPLARDRLLVVAITFRQQLTSSCSQARLEARVSLVV